MLPHSTRHVLSSVLSALLVFAFSATASAQGWLFPSDESLPPLTIAEHRVQFEVQDGAAITHVTQVFRNNTDSVLEGIYYFAVPPGSVTTEFALWMNGERIRGEVLEKGRARQIYQSIVSRMRDPGLLEYVDGELFQASIYPIPARGTQTVEIEFANVLEQSGDTLHYRYPVHESAGNIGTFSVSGTISSNDRIASIYSPYHRISENRERGAVRVTMEESSPDLSEDFELFIGVAREDVGFSMISYDADDGGDGYFMLTLAPSAELNELEVLPKQVTYVVDTSGSMAGEKIQQARQTLLRCLDNLNPEDHFQVITFSSDVEAAFSEPVTATAANIREAREIANGLRAQGNTNISGALVRALRDASSPDRPHSIIFLTDGVPTEGETDVDSILRSTSNGVSDGDRRIFTFGVGYDVNTRLLDGMATRGRGKSGYVRPNQDIAEVVGTFMEGIDSPILTRLALDFGSVDVSQLYPNPLPDLYRGQQITVFGRYDARSSDEIVVSGRAGGRNYRHTYPAAFGERTHIDTSFIANLWASRRVSSLLDEIQQQGESQSRISEVVSLATKWGIVTPYTSYLTVEPGTVMPEEERNTNEDQRVRRAEPARDFDVQSGAFEGRSDRFLSAEQPTDAYLGGADFGGVGGGRGGPSSFSGDAPPAPAAPRFSSAPVGQAAVEDSIARREAAENLTVDLRGSVRTAAGRSFTLRHGVWAQTGVETGRVDRTIRFASDEYFELLTRHPELAEVLALGERVRFELNGEVIECAP